MVNRVPLKITSPCIYPQISYFVIIILSITSSRGCVSLTIHCYGQRDILLHHGNYQDFMASCINHLCNLWTIIRTQFPLGIGLPVLRIIVAVLTAVRTTYKLLAMNLDEVFGKLFWVFVRSAIFDRTHPFLLCTFLGSFTTWFKPILKPF